MAGMQKIIALFIAPFMLVFNIPFVCLADEDQPKQPTVEIIHEPVERAPAGERVVVQAEIQDKNGVDVVRAYFKSEDGANYNFVEMVPEDPEAAPIIDATYTAVLPAPANGTKSFTYLILVKNTFNVVVKSQNYWVEVTPTDIITPPVAEPIKVYTELPEVPSQITGFSDNMTYDTVESAVKFGIVAGLYQTMSKGAEGVIYGGTVATSTGGVGTGTIILGSLAVAAVVGGAVALASGGGGSSSDDSNDNGTTCTYQGAWSGSYSETDCSGLSYQGAWGGTVDANCYFTATDTTTNDGFLEGSINASTGAAELTGYVVDCGAISSTASFSQTSVRGSFDGGATGTFSGAKN